MNIPELRQLNIELGRIIERWSSLKSSDVIQLSKQSRDPGDNTGTRIRILSKVIPHRPVPTDKRSLKV